MCEIELKLYKTNQTGPLMLLQIPYVLDCYLCPVSAMRAFLNVRPRLPVPDMPLFVHYYLTPLTIYQFSAMLKRALCHAHKVIDT